MHVHEKHVMRAAEARLAVQNRELGLSREEGVVVEVGCKVACR